MLTYADVCRASDTTVGDRWSRRPPRSPARPDAAIMPVKRPTNACKEMMPSVALNVYTCVNIYSFQDMVVRK